MKRIIVFGLSIMLTISMIGCGKNASATSNESSDLDVQSRQEDEIDENVAEGDEEAVEESESNEVAPTEETASTPEDIDLSAAETTTNASTNWEDYMDGNVFDLTSYAEAIGYTWVPDPEYDSLAMYYIDNGGIRYFFCYSGGLISIYFGDEQGRCCHTSGIRNGAFEHIDYVVVSKGQPDIEVSMENMLLIASTLNYLASPGANILEIPGCVYGYAVRGGTVSYFPNGMIRQRDFANYDIVEEYACTNTDLDLML